MLSAQYFTAQADLLHHQVATLPPVSVFAGETEGFEESQSVIDVRATAERIARHRAQAASGTPHPLATYEELFVRFIDAMGYENISGVEIAAVHKRVTRSGVRNRIPEPWLALRLAIVLRIDQEIRYRAGQPLRFNSLVRATDYNRAIRGASKSQHRVGTARDRVLVGGSIRDLVRLDAQLATTVLGFTPEQQRVLQQWRRRHGLDERAFTRSIYGEPFSMRGVGWTGMSVRVDGGIGQYRTFVHSDNRGVRARWNG